MNAHDLIVLALLGGVLGLDTVSFPQAMLSRPIVACTLTGLLLGYAAPGLLLGATLELFAVETLPFGASRYPEWGSSSVVGTSLFASGAVTRPGALVTAVLGTLMVAWVGGWSMVRLRKLNARWARRRHAAVTQGDRRAVVGLQLAGLGADLVRGIALTALALLVLTPIQSALLDTWNARQEVGRGIVAVTAGAVALGAAYKLFHAVHGFAWQFAAGLAVGLAILVVL
ncbi:MAG TPA: PTS sugar transporter subunit IIC [Gemmatimonadaceae bacterium]